MVAAKSKIIKLLNSAGIQVNGSKPWDMQVHNEQLYNRVIIHGSVGLGEAYMDGWWDADELDSFFTRILKADLYNAFSYTPANILLYIQTLLTNMQSRKKAFQIGEHHYDIGNDLYQVMLDERMVYTCGYWQESEDLSQAQIAKLDLVCRKIGLSPGQKVLDIGCGWGGFAKYASEMYGAKVTGITVSRKQAEIAHECCMGLPVEIRIQDYRDVSETFDHIVSLGMLEHVGSKNYRDYIQKVHDCLSDDGLFLLHTIGSSVSVRKTDPWIDKYIFPNSMLPSITQLGSAFEGLMVMEDWHNFGPDYDKTLMAWFHNFNRGWNQLKDNYSERFYRMWKYFLLMSAGSFRSRTNQVWQIVLSKTGLPEGYRRRGIYQVQDLNVY
jgi:cyclopropane-fatty-acyl-phospholipid synthase